MQTDSSVLKDFEDSLSEVLEVAQEALDAGDADVGPTVTMMPTCPPRIW